MLLILMVLISIDFNVKVIFQKLVKKIYLP